MTKAVKIRLAVLSLTFIAAFTLGMDYMLAACVESLLDDSPSEFTTTVEADLCNAITDESYYSSRFFLDRAIKQRNLRFEFVSGRCQRNTDTTLRITQDKAI